VPWAVASFAPSEAKRLRDTATPFEVDTDAVRRPAAAVTPNDLDVVFELRDPLKVVDVIVGARVGVGVGTAVGVAVGAGVGANVAPTVAAGVGDAEVGAVGVGAAVAPGVQFVHAAASVAAKSTSPAP
jgi:hypothetical protein